MRKILPSFILLCTGFISFGQVNKIKLDSFFNSLSSRGLVSGNIAISQQGKILYKKAMGMAVMDSNKVVADTNTKYRIGSATKMFTAVMIFQLIDEGKLSIDNKLSMFFPALPNAPGINIGQLLAHRSGLHDYTDDTGFEQWMQNPVSKEYLLNIIKEKGSDFEPGSRAAYSNSNYLLLGYIIEKITGQAYADVLYQRITGKLKLTNTGFPKPAATDKSVADSYKYSNGQWIKQKKTNPGIHGGAGMLQSTASDLLIFINGLFSGKLMSKSSLAAMMSLKDDYGMGIFANKYGSRPSFGHNGRIEEFYTAAWHYPGKQLSVVYCTNGILYPRTDIMEMVLKILYNEPVEIPFAKTNTTTDLDSFAGKYSDGQLVVNCSVTAGKLSFETNGKSFITEKISEGFFMNRESGYFFDLRKPGELQVKETDNTYVLKKMN